MNKRFLSLFLACMLLLPLVQAGAAAGAAGAAGAAAAASRAREDQDSWYAQNSNLIGRAIDKCNELGGRSRRYSYHSLDEISCESGLKSWTITINGDGSINNVKENLFPFDYSSFMSIFVLIIFLFIVVLLIIPLTRTLTK